MGNNLYTLGYETSDQDPYKLQNPSFPGYVHGWASNDWGDTGPGWLRPKKEKPEIRSDRINAAPTLAELWRRRGMLGQKAMDKSGKRYQIGG